MQDDIDLSGKVVIITGAGRGIGKAIALALAKSGGCVVIAARSEPEIGTVAAQIRAQGLEAMPVIVDVTEPMLVDRMKEAVIREYGRIDILINCAGIYGGIGNSWELSVEEWSASIRVNLFGTFACCRSVLPQMLRQEEGRIINMAGGGATSPLARLSGYACSKAAVVRLTETLAEELQCHNIRVNAVAPGTVDTQIQDQILGAGDKAGALYRQIEELRETGQGGVPMELVTGLVKRLLAPEFGQLSGKLISARYDDWSNWGLEEIRKIMSGSLYSLRRIDNYSLQSARPIDR